MKNLLYIVLVAFAGLAMGSCDDYETYSEKRDRELNNIDAFIASPSYGEIKGKPIKVISESEFLAHDTVTDCTKNEFVLLEASGVYMQIVSRGCGSVLKDGESATVLCRFTEYNMNTGENRMTNDSCLYQPYYEKFNVRNVSGSMYGTAEKKEYGTGYQGFMGAYMQGGIPEGWLVPLRYIKIGRPSKADDEIAKLRLIVPHDKTHSDANNKTYACYYEITYQRGI